jgi:GntR family transcriptional repressor for pyruvate dehydrogenase complex
MASDDWAPVRRIRSYEQVMEQIEQRITDGLLKSGDHLPSERDLAAQLGVSRPTLRESLRVLEALGILDIRRGGGADGGAILLPEPGSGMVSLLRLQLALSHFDETDVMETRLAMEEWAVAEAARRSTPEDHAELAELLDRMDDTTIDSSEFNRLDAAFHVRVARSTGNALLAHFMESLRSAIHRQMVDMYAELDDWRATVVTVREEHRAILRTISEGDAEKAVALVREHIKDFYEDYRKKKADGAGSAR